MGNFLNDSHSNAQRTKTKHLSSDVSNLYSPNDDWRIEL